MKFNMADHPDTSYMNRASIELCIWTGDSIGSQIYGSTWASAWIIAGNLLRSFDARSRDYCSIYGIGIWDLWSGGLCVWVPQLSHVSHVSVCHKTCSYHKSYMPLDNVFEYEISRIATSDLAYILWFLPMFFYFSHLARLAFKWNCVFIFTCHSHSCGGCQIAKEMDILRYCWAIYVYF